MSESESVVADGGSSASGPVFLGFIQGRSVRTIVEIRQHGPVTEQGYGDDVVLAYIANGVLESSQGRVTGYEGSMLYWPIPEGGAEAEEIGVIEFIGASGGNYQFRGMFTSGPWVGGTCRIFVSQVWDEDWLRGLVRALDGPEW